MGVRSATWTAADLDPSDLANQTHLLARYFAMLKTHFANFLEGGLIVTPTTPSAQLTGTGNTTWNINIQALAAVVNGYQKEFTLQADTAIHSGSYLTGFANGASCIAAVVLKEASGTITVVTVKGTPATTGSQVAPLDGAIQTAVGAGNAWLKIGEATLNRTADTTVTESFNNLLRPVLGVTVDTAFGTFSG